MGVRQLTRITTSEGPVRTLRTTYWDGPPPAPGDVVVHPDGLFRVLRVARGAGVGQWVLVCVEARRIDWTT